MRVAKRKESEAENRGAGEESLVPVIEEEERRLETMLEETRREADRRVHDAEVAAAERLEAARRSLPEIEAKIKERAALEFEREAATLRDRGDDELAVLEARAKTNRKAALERIVDAVWAGGR